MPPSRSLKLKLSSVTRAYPQAAALRSGPRSAQKRSTAAAKATAAPMSSALSAAIPASPTVRGAGSDGAAASGLRCFGCAGGVSAEDRSARADAPMLAGNGPAEAAASGPSESASSALKQDCDTGRRSGTDGVRVSQVHLAVLDT